MFWKSKETPTMPQRVQEFERKLSAIVIEAKLQNVADSVISKVMQNHIDGMRHRAAVNYAAPRVHNVNLPE
jgi:hypothetical protein